MVHAAVQFLRRPGQEDGKSDFDNIVRLSQNGERKEDLDVG